MGRQESGFLFLILEKLAMDDVVTGRENSLGVTDTERCLSKVKDVDVNSQLPVHACLCSAALVWAQNFNPRVEFSFLAS